MIRPEKTKEKTGWTRVGPFSQRKGSNFVAWKQKQTKNYYSGQSPLRPTDHTSQYHKPLGHENFIEDKLHPFSDHISRKKRREGTQNFLYSNEKIPRQLVLLKQSGSVLIYLILLYSVLYDSVQGEEKRRESERAEPLKNGQVHFENVRYSIT